LAFANWKMKEISRRQRAIHVERLQTQHVIERGEAKSYLQPF
jgi:hypothetical protein